jgi:hypothetical protein
VVRYRFGCLLYDVICATIVVSLLFGLSYLLAIM